jgi:hypothetical protein
MCRIRGYGDDAPVQFLVASQRFFAVYYANLVFVLCLSRVALIVSLLSDQKMVIAFFLMMSSGKAEENEDTIH